MSRAGCSTPVQRPELLCHRSFPCRPRAFWNSRFLSWVSCQSIPLGPSRPISVFISSRKTSMIPQEDTGYNLWALFCDMCVNLLFFSLKMILFSFFFSGQLHMVILVPHQGSNLHSLHWKHWVLKIGPLGKFLSPLGQNGRAVCALAALQTVAGNILPTFLLIPHTSHLALSDP